MSFVWESWFLTTGQTLNTSLCWAAIEYDSKNAIVSQSNYHKVKQIKTVWEIKANDCRHKYRLSQLNLKQRHPAKMVWFGECAVIAGAGRVPAAHTSESNVNISIKAS